MKPVHQWAFIAGICLIAALLAPGGSGAAIPRTMSYQGLLTDANGAIVADGIYDLEFRLYNVAAGGGALWTESQADVPVNGGLLMVMLGSVVPLDLPFDEAYWLGVAVGGESELVPRMPLSASPYALTVEPQSGMAQARINGGSSVIGNANNLLRDLTVVITIPAAGYISLDASGMVGFNGATNEQTMIYGIAESPEFTFPPEPGYTYYCGFGTVPNSNYMDFPFFCRRTYYKAAAGTYSFSLGTGRLGNFGPSINTYIFNTVLNAVYYPAAYGTVTTTASQSAPVADPHESVPGGVRP